MIGRGAALSVLVLAAAGAPACGPVDEGGDSGTLRITVSPEGGSPVVGRNAFSIEVRGEDGTLLPGLAVSALPWMVTHNHGSTEAAAVRDEGAGRYRAYPVTLFMAGEWQLSVRAEGEGESGTAVRRYLVP